MGVFWFMAAGRHVQSYVAMSGVWSAVSRTERRGAVTQRGGRSLSETSRGTHLKRRPTLCTSALYMPQNNNFVHTQYSVLCIKLGNASRKSGTNTLPDSGTCGSSVNLSPCWMLNIILSVELSLYFVHLAARELLYTVCISVLNNAVIHIIKK